MSNGFLPKAGYAIANPPYKGRWHQNGWVVTKII